MGSKKKTEVKDQTMSVKEALELYIAASGGVKAADEQLARVKGVASKAAFELCKAAGIVCGASTYANCTACTQEEFKAFWTGLGSGDKIAFVGRANSGAGWTQANRKEPLKGVEAIIKRVSEMDADDLKALETAIQARRLALEEKAAEKAVKAAEKKAAPKAPAAAPAAGVTAEAMEVMLRKMLAGMGVAVAAK